MLNLLKPFVGPVVVFVAQWLADKWMDVSPLVTGAAIGFAAFWLMLALLSHRKLLRRFPWLLEWMPFLDPSGGFTSSKELTGKYINGHTFRISDLALFGVIEGRTFEDCRIYGPAVLNLGGFGTLHQCVFNGPREGVLLPVKGEFVVGAIAVRTCHFRRCTFINVGFVGNEDDIKRWSDQIQDASPREA